MGTHRRGWVGVGGPHDLETPDFVPCRRCSHMGDVTRTIRGRDKETRAARVPEQNQRNQPPGSARHETYCIGRPAGVVENKGGQTGITLVACGSYCGSWCIPTCWLQIPLRDNDMRPGCKLWGRPAGLQGTDGLQQRDQGC